MGPDSDARVKAEAEAEAEAETEAGRTVVGGGIDLELADDAAECDKDVGNGPAAGGTYEDEYKDDDDEDDDDEDEDEDDDDDDDDDDEVARRKGVLSAKCNRRTFFSPSPGNSESCIESARQMPANEPKASRSVDTSVLLIPLTAEVKTFWARGKYAVSAFSVIAPNPRFSYALRVSR